MKTDSVPSRPDQRDELPAGTIQWDRSRVPAAAAWSVAGIVTTAAVLLVLLSGIDGMWLAIVLWLAAGAMFWGGVFMPFRIGWVGVVIGLMIHGTLAACAPTILYGMMSH